MYARHLLFSLGALLLSVLALYLPTGQEEPRLWLVTAVASYLLLRQGPSMLPWIALAGFASSGRLMTLSGWAMEGFAAPLILLTGTACLTVMPLTTAWSLKHFGERTERSGKVSLLGALFSVGLGTAAATAIWTLSDWALHPQPDLSPATLGYRFLSLGLAPLVILPLYLLNRGKTFRLPGNASGEHVAWALVAWLTGSFAVATSSQGLLLTLPLFIWSALRMETHVSVALNGLTVLTLLTLLPPLHTGMPHADWVLQAELAVYFISALFLGATIADRRQIEARLEDRVLQRTQDLQQINQELQDEVFIRKQAEKSLLSSSRKYRSLIDTAGSPIVILDRDFRIRQWNRAASELFGEKRDDIQGKDFVHAFMLRSFQEETAWKIQKVFESGQTLENLENEILDAQGRTLVMLWNVARFVVPGGDSDMQVIVVGQNITSIRETQNQLHFLAHYDVLTGAANRRLFEDRCRQALKQGYRSGHDVGLIGLDVDHFKRINDTLGHDVGDELLKVLFSRMKDCVREEDTIARLGGDEFAILLNKVNGREGCLKVAENLLKSITKPVQVPGQQLIITTSIGVTLAPQDGTDYAILLKNADMAMYRAKKNGRNTIQFYEPELGEEMAHQLNIEQALRHGLDQNEFILYFQPQVDLEDNRVIGFEALLRWHHPQKGLLTPMHFLDIAEQSGLLPTLGVWIIDSVFDQAQTLQKLFAYPLRISVNLSGRELRHPTLIPHVKEALERTRLDPQLISFEVSEPAIVSNIDDSLRALNQLKALGVSLTIDSFGSGLTSLSHLATMPVDMLKVHHSLIGGVPEESYDTAIFNTLVAIAQGMGLRLVVEGVETEAQENFFRGKGIRYVQGHRFAAPIPAEQLPRFLQQLSNGEIGRNQTQMGLPLQ